MVDELLFSDDNITKTSFTVTADNVFVINGEFSEAGLMENMAQTAAAGSGNMARIEAAAGCQWLHRPGKKLRDL
jgi:hypothetical protein